MFSRTGKYAITGAVTLMFVSGMAFAQTSKPAAAKPASKPAATKPVLNFTPSGTAIPKKLGTTTAKKVAEKAPKAGVVATVNGIAISQNDLVNKLIRWSAAPTLDEMIDVEVFNQAAKKEGVSISDKEVSDKITEIKKNVPPGQDMDQFLRRRGSSYKHFEDQVRVRLLIEKAARKSIKVDDDELTKVHASHILIRVNTPTDQNNEAEMKKIEQEAEQKANEVLSAVKAQGADFAAIAKDKSEDPYSKEKGGDLGFFRRGRMVGEFDAVAFKLKPGEISDVVRTQYGFHIIKILEVRTAKDMTPAEKEKDREEIISDQLSKAMNDWTTKVKDAAKVKRYSYE